MKISKIFKNKIAFTILIILFSIFLINFIVYIIPDEKIDGIEYYSNSVKYYDRNGVLLRYAPSETGEWKLFLPYDKIPKKLISSIIQAEDKRFYWHFGFDLISIARSLAQNIKEKKIVSGSSTLTMQLARILYPHKAGIPGKIYEILRATQIEIKKSKKWILEKYINNVPFGYNSAGFPAASYCYYDKSINELSEEEIAVLCIIPRAPTKYNPFKNREVVFNAVKRLLLNSDGKIDERKLYAAIDGVKERTTKFDSPHFINLLQNELKTKFNRDVYKKTVEIKTTIDNRLQKSAENIVESLVDKYKNNRLTNASVIVLDNKSGEILAYIGSKDFFQEDISGQIDGTKIKNQPGSTLKPFLYALALENGFTPATILPDFELNLGGEENYKPKNYNLRTNGPVRFRVALASSLNIPAVYLLNRLGVKNFINHLLSLNFLSIIENKEDYPGIGLALGNSEVKLTELADAYSVFGRDGVFKKSTGFKEIKTIDSGFIKFDPESHIQKKFVKEYRPKTIYDSKTVFIIFDILSDNKSRSLGFGSSQFFIDKKVAVKTGTSSQFGNIWAICLSKEFTVAVWGGNFNGNTVRGVPGASLPLEIASKIIDILPIQKNEISPPPELTAIRICSLSGMRPNGLCASLTTEYFDKTISGNIPICTYHKVGKNNDAYVSFPVEFVHWAKSRGLLSAYQENEMENSAPKILFPTDGSVFFYDPGESASKQGLTITVACKNGGKPLYYSLNNEGFIRLDYPYKKFIQLSKNEYRLRIYDNDKNLAETVNFSVK
ncbi:MAG TPA: penicillin-binding protein 1C [Spirochaetota bacterium]|nr:penicillin-binding protein 1C [Spirochaetota bacterium]HOS55206.1 penicillin-binding protein 1C [Spirochaetota bacterium]HPK61438.1 penicillin-binding protein 1C [Spirochaetota bacterium]HQF78559.1 penicillin-binding protein 1C [Spirochaetota bacterium]HQH30430.1 penicillin-binding protein 1C [Spirochaetota bacterium]